jgi:hypothetical protein
MKSKNKKCVAIYDLTQTTTLKLTIWLNGIVLYVL